MPDRSTKNDPRFVEYYAQESLTAKAAERAQGIMRAVLLAKARNAEFGAAASFEVASATQLPWEAARFDVALLPELLEHVDDWESVLNEAVRVIKPGGSLFLSTTNVLCPVQQEFALPMYSWYPGWLKKHYLKRSLTDAPHLANFATYPAVHWFSPYGLKRFLAKRGVVASDRFDLIDTTHRGGAARAVLGAIRLLPPLRFAAHVATPSTLMYGRKQDSHRAALTTH
jgi:2-polyprenyl-6-hydroxyphenyl methylase/3-demethylubiquinone-9 3-methyltransferase